MTTVECDDLTVRIAGRTILEHVNLHIPQGSMIALTGPSGCGKTTLLHTLGLLQQADGGRLIIDHEDVTHASSGRRRRFWHDTASFILQDYGIMDEESVEFNVSMQLGPFGQRAGGDRRRIHEALRATGLAKRIQEPASHLSGGEKQRLGIARAIYKNASVIFADEPTASLDARNRQIVIDLLRRRTGEGTTIVLATHDPVLMSVCDRNYPVNDRANDRGNASWGDTATAVSDERSVTHSANVANNA